MKTNTPYEWRYDATEGHGYLKLSTAKITKTIELRPNVYLDKAEDGTVVGIEILHI